MKERWKPLLLGLNEGDIYWKGEKYLIFGEKEITLQTPDKVLKRKRPMDEQDKINQLENKLFKLGRLEKEGKKVDGLIDKTEHILFEAVDKKLNTHQACEICGARCENLSAHISSCHKEKPLTYNGIEATNEEELIKIRKEWDENVERPTKASKRPLENPKIIKEENYIPLPEKEVKKDFPEMFKGKKKIRKDSAMSATWNREVKQKELKKKIKEEKEELYNFQYSLGKEQQPKEYLRYSFKTNELKVIPLGDFHYGADSCQVEKIKETINYIKRTNSQVILMGDLMENSTRYSVGAGVYDQSLTPMKQMNQVYELLKPIKDQILVSLCGNHEWRTYKECGFNPAIILAEKLDVPYGGFKTFLEIKVNKYKYVVYATHGSTGARLPWTRMKAVDDVARNVNADVILYGHTHDLYAHPFLEEGIKDHKKMECLTGGFLGDSPYGYIAMKNLPPMKTGVVKLKLFGDRWDIHASD